MLKKLAMIAVSGVFVVALAGCASGAGSSAASSSASASAASSAASSSAAASSESASSTSAGSSLFTNEEWPKNDVTAAVPAPSFGVPIESLNTSDRMVSASWKGVSESDASAYIEAIKGAGFTYQASENKSASSYNYSATNNENISASTSVILGYTSDGNFNLSVTNYAL